MSGQRKNSKATTVGGLTAVVAAILCAVLGIRFGTDREAEPPAGAAAETTVTEAARTQTGETAAPAASSLTFSSRNALNEHYKKHGIEMGFASAEEYLAAANAVVANPAALHKLEKEDNDHVYYLEATNEFVVVSQKGFIRTYFCPDSGKAYFDRQ